MLMSGFTLKAVFIKKKWCLACQQNNATQAITDNFRVTKYRKSTEKLEL